MRNYFNEDIDTERPEYNEDYYERLENRSRFSLDDAVEYDKQFVNKILNYEILTESDKQNIADVISGLAYQLLDSSDTNKSFEDFLIEVNGKEWYDNMISAWLRRKSRVLANQWNCPELANNWGVYLLKPDEDNE